MHENEKAQDPWGEVVVVLAVEVNHLLGVVAAEEVEVPTVNQTHRWLRVKL
jgi:hypothetical protein